LGVLRVLLGLQSEGRNGQKNAGKNQSHTYFLGYGDIDRFGFLLEVVKVDKFSLQQKKFKNPDVGFLKMEKHRGNISASNYANFL